MIALVLTLALCLALALALSLVLAFALPLRVAQRVAAERSRTAVRDPVSSGETPKPPAVAEAAVLAASLRVLLDDLDRSAREAPSQDGPSVPDPRPRSQPRAELPPQTPPPDSCSPFWAPVETTRRAPAARPPASRERPTPRAVTPPGSARALPPEPGIVAARLGPRPDTAWSRHRGDVPPRSAVFAQTMPSMPAVGASGARPPPAIAVEAEGAARDRGDPSLDSPARSDDEAS